MCGLIAVLIHVDACELSVKDVAKVLKELEDIIEWYSLGTYLEVASSALGVIERENITIKLRMIKMLEHWLRTGRGCSWRKLVEALYQMGELTVADNIRRKHLSLTTPVLPKCKHIGFFKSLCTWFRF